MTAHVKRRRREGWVMSRGLPNCEFIRARSAGAKTHIISEVLIRWNHWGGTHEVPIVDLLTMCGIGPFDINSPRGWRGEVVDEQPIDKMCKGCVKRARREAKHLTTR